jgi:pimeloyl-ACP methyl ester carboxylesterase
MKLALETMGHGPGKVIVLHDWTTCRDSYNACHGAGDPERFTYAFVDLRGYGESCRFAGAMTAAEVVGDLADTADALRWSEFSLVGHSMSGVPALLAARRLGWRVRALVLVTPVPARGVPVDSSTRSMLVSSATDDGPATEVATMLTSGRLAAAWYRAKVTRQRRTVSRAATLGYLDM